MTRVRFFSAHVSVLIIAARQVTTLCGAPAGATKCQNFLTALSGPDCALHEWSPVLARMVAQASEAEQLYILNICRGRLQGW